MRITALLSPSVASDALAATLSGLPTRLRWPAEMPFVDYTDSPEAVAAGMGAELTVAGTTWSLRDSRSQLSRTFEDGCMSGQSAVSAVDVTWGLEIDAETGSVWAVPSFSGIKVTSDGTLNELCASLGFTRRRIGTVPAALAPVYVVVNGAKVPVYAAPGITPAQFAAAIASPKFKDWVDSMDPSLAVSRVTIQSVDLFGKNVGFLKLSADITKDGKFVPGIAFIRGDSVAMLVVLDCEGELYSPLTVQPRSCVGSAAFTETAAGMLDAQSFLGAAATEMNQELGFSIPADELIDLREVATGQTGSVALSPGGCDEEMRFFLYRRTVTRSELAALEGKLTGELSEGEIITLKVVPLNDVWSVGDGKTLIAMGLYLRARLRRAI